MHGVVQMMHNVISQFIIYYWVICANHYCNGGLLNAAAGPGGSFSGLTNEGKIAVASAVTAFVIGSVLFVIGFLCRHFCRKEKETTQLQTGTITQCEKTQGAPYYDDVVIKQHEQELELKENVAYAPVF